MIIDIVQHVPLPIPRPSIQYIQTGVSYMDTFIYAGCTFLVGCVLGYYIKSVGMAGIELDLKNIKTDVQDLKTKVSSNVPATVAVPVTSTVTTPAVIPTAHLV